MRDMLLDISQAAIVGVAREERLRLTEEQALQIAQLEQDCLVRGKRISFGGSAAMQMIREFSHSTYLVGEDASETLCELTEAFYDIREDLPAETTDLEIIEVLRDSFDGPSAGVVALAAVRARRELAAERFEAAYEIVDDDGNVYRWNPAEWHDDIQADGWYGEKWGECDD